MGGGAGVRLLARQRCPGGGVGVPSDRAAAALAMSEDADAAAEGQGGEGASLDQPRVLQRLQDAAPGEGGGPADEALQPADALEDGPRLRRAPQVGDQAGRLGDGMTGIGDGGGAKAVAFGIEIEPLDADGDCALDDGRLTLA